jgi:hypothetical protein
LAGQIDGITYAAASVVIGITRGVAAAAEYLPEAMMDFVGARGALAHGRLADGATQLEIVRLAIDGSAAGNNLPCAWYRIAVESRFQTLSIPFQISTYAVFSPPSFFLNKTNIILLSTNKFRAATRSIAARIAESKI